MQANWRDGRLCFKDVQVACGDAHARDADVPECVGADEGYARFDVRIDKIELRLSLQRWLQGHGLVRGAVVEGLRGVLDRRWVPAGARSGSGDGDGGGGGGFELDEGVVVQDAQLQVLQPRGYAPYSVNLLAAKLPRLRQRWFFYDCISADSAHGVFDGHALFAWHVPRDPVSVGVGVGVARDTHSPMPSTPTPTPTHTHTHTHPSLDVQRLRHFRMLGLNVQQLAQGQANDHALAWLTKGTVDIEGFLQLPSAPSSHAGPRAHAPGDPFLLDTLKERVLLGLLEQTGTAPEPRPGRLAQLLPPELLERVATALLPEGRAHVDAPAPDSAAATARLFLHAPPDSVALHVAFVFRNLRARLPPAHELPLARASLLRPAIAYINAHRPGIPLATTVVLARARFAGAWGGWECGLFPGVAAGLEAALDALVWDPERRLRRIGRVSRWTVQGIVRSMSELVEAS